MPLLKTEQESVPAVNHTAPLDTTPKADNKALSSPSCDGDDEKVTTPPYRKRHGFHLIQSLFKCS